MAVSALVLGIVGLVLSLNVFTSFTGLICGILAIIFGAIGVTKKDNDRGKGVAGIVLGAITLIICVILVIVILKTYDYIQTNLPRILEELTELIETSLENLENAINETVEDIKNSVIDEVERQQEDIINNLF